MMDWSRDPEVEAPVPTSIRPTYEALLASLDAPPEGVEGVDAAMRKQIHDAVEDYGEVWDTVRTPEWRTSICRWMEDGWQVWVDLGDTDLVLVSRVYEEEAGLRIVVAGVWVP